MCTLHRLFQLSFLILEHLHIWAVHWSEFSMRTPLWGPLGAIRRDRGLERTKWNIEYVKFQLY